MLRRATMASISLLAVGGLIAVAPLGAATAGAKSAHPAAIKVASPKIVKGGKVIVILKDQPAVSIAHLAIRTRTASTMTAHTARAQVASAVRSVGGTVRANLTLVNAVAATVTGAQATALAKRSDVAAVIPDALIQEGSSSDAAAVAAAAKAATPAPTSPVPGACPANPNKVALQPEALSDTHTDSDTPGAKTARSLGYTGAGVTVAYMAEGIDIHNPDFTRNGKSVFSDYKDFSGDGLNAPTSGGEAFIDASAIAAQGKVAYNLQHFSGRPLNRACKIRVEGEAPGVNLVGLKVYSNGFSSTSGFLQAIDYAVNHDHVNVLNESFGGNPIPDTSQDVIVAADNAAVAAGTTVTASTGDAGITNTISSPSDDPNVISVGASTTFQEYLQTGYGGSRFPGINGWKNDNISSLSSSGFTSNGTTLDLVAPGDLNWALCTPDLAQYADCFNYLGNPSAIEDSGGTSESAPTVAGVAALVIQAYKAGHHGTAPTPAQVKDILTSTADDIDAPAEQQGAGLVDAYKAVVLAKSYGGNGKAGGPVVQSSAVQFNKVAAPNTAESVSDTLTNRGTSTQTISASSRTLGAYQTISTKQVTLSDATSPKYTDFQGLPDNFAKVTFHVPAGQDRLSASIAYQAADITDLAARDRMTVVDPTGALVGYSLPQGLGNFGHVEVRNPVPGKWTAYITSRTSANGGSEGDVQFAAAVADYTTLGTVTPATLTLAPGQSGVVTLRASTPKTPGDLGASLVLTSNAANTTSDVTTVPVTLRSEIPSGTQSFTQTLTGPNGRDEYPGADFSYQTTVAAGTPELNAAVNLTEDPNNQFQAALISPDGNVTAFAANVQTTTSPLEGTVEELVSGLQLHTLKPQAGIWTMTVQFAPVVDGTNISTPFTVSTDDTPVVASSDGLPDSSSTVLPAGKTADYFVKVTNSGPSPESYFVDGRLSKSVKYNLVSVTDSEATAPVTDNVPEYLVPSHTTQIAVAATTDGTKPIQFDFSSPIGDPDIASTAGLTANGNYAAAAVTPGLWFVAPSQVGPYFTAATPEDLGTAMSAKTRAFDPALSSSTGDLWQTALDPNLTLNAVTVQPGDTAVIEVKITPTAGAHSVSGTLYIDDTDLVADEYGTFISPNANDVAALPYAYSVN
jgi:Subtilase family